MLVASFLPLLIAGFSSIQGVAGDCDRESTALGACFSANSFPDPLEDACEACFERVVDTHFRTPNCGSVAEAVCQGITICNCGDGICLDELDAYIGCEINDERDAFPGLASCPEPLSCGASNGFSSTPAATTPAATTPAATNPAVTLSTSNTASFSSQCETESQELGSCFDANGVSEAQESVCEQCLEGAILANFRASTCSNIYSTVEDEISLCNCPRRDRCIEQINRYVTCEVEKERREEGLDDCLDEAITTAAVTTPDVTAPAATTPAITMPAVTPTPDVASSPMSNTVSFSAECEMESEELGSCFDANAVSGAHEFWCEQCLERAVLANFRLSTCSSIYSSVKEDISGCFCPRRDRCRDQINNYVTCGVEKERREEELGDCLNEAATTVVTSWEAVPSSAPATFLMGAAVATFTAIVAFL